MRNLITPFLFIVLTATLTAGCDSGSSDEDGVQTRDLVVGAGDVIVNQQTLIVSYIGKLDNGTVFDSSIGRGEDFIFTFGVGQVIDGWDMGMVGMRVGGKRQIIIPPFLAYGTRGLCLGNGTCPVPPNSTLTFQVTVLGIMDDIIIEEVSQVESEFQAKEGDTVTVEYTGSILNGGVFDSSKSRGEPLVFTIGAGDQIDGLERGVTGMWVGSVRNVTIPPSLAFGANGNGSAVPPWSILKYRLELVELSTP